jgi:hypothetical protein
MLERILDVLLQRWRRLLGLVALVAAAAWAIGLALDHSPRVVVRVWADEPVLLVNGGTGGQPGATAASTLRELVASDAFLDPILAAADPGFASSSPRRRADLETELRDHLEINSTGDHVVTLRYATDRPAYGAGLTLRLATAFADQTIATMAAQVAAARPGPASALSGARDSVAWAAARLGTHAAPSTTLETRAYLNALIWQAKDDATRNAIVAALDSADPSSTADLSLRQATIRVIDAPAITQPAPLSSSLAVRFFWLGLAGAAALGLALLTFVGISDRRVRSATDLARRTGIPYLTSTPTLPSPASGGGKILR